MPELVSKTFRHLLCWDTATVFANAMRLLTSFVFLQQSEILYWENNLDKEFRELKQQNQNTYSGWTVGDTVTLLIISVVFRYLLLNFRFSSLLSFPTLNQPIFTSLATRENPSLVPQAMSKQPASGVPRLKAWLLIIRWPPAKNWIWYNFFSIKWLLVLIYWELKGISLVWQHECGF